ncbi:MAG: DUF4003 family protein [Bacillota bacterium]
MDNKSLQMKVEKYRDIYSQLRKALKWHTDQRTLMLVATMYVAKSTDFDIKKFIELADYIKGRVSVFSYLKTPQRFTTASILETTTSNSKQAFEELLSIYEKLIEKGFSRTTYSYIAAGTLLNKNGKANHYIEKTIQLYKSMKEHHYILTNSSDYPLAALLAQNDDTVDHIVFQMEDNYQQLQLKNFRKGNDLQFLSHILTLRQAKGPEESAEKCMSIKDDLLQIGIKSKSLYYPYIGMLSFLEDFTKEIPNLQEVYHQLTNDKLFKWQKDMNFMLSVLFLMIEKTEMNDVVTAGLNTSIEAIIQAQQAVMVASVSAVAATSSSHGG